MILFLVWVGPQKIEGATGDLLMNRRILKTSSPISFVMSAMSAMPVIDVASYHPAPASIDYRNQACKGRRTSPEHADRNFRPFIYAAFQCTGFAVDWPREESWFLCPTCERHRSTGSPDWHGRVDKPLDQMPITSHIAGGAWYNKMVAEGKFKINDRPLTAKQEGHLDRAPIVPEAQLKRFARGEIDLDVETLAAKRQISTMGLIGILCDLNVDISRKVRYGTKAGLCAAIREAIREAMVPPPAQHFNPEEDNYEAEAASSPPSLQEAFEPEVQHMAPAGDEDELNTAFFEEEAEPEQGGAGGGYLYELEHGGDDAGNTWRENTITEWEPRPTPKRYVPNWGLIAVGTQVRWVIKTLDRTLTSCGLYAGEGKIQFGQQMVKGPCAFIKQELAVWKSNGRLPADMKAPRNAWKALEFERNGAWVRFDAIRSAVV